MMIEGLMKTDSEQIENIVDFAAENADTIIHLISNSEILDDIPLLGTVNKAFKTGTTIRDQIFAKKVWRFLTTIRDISETERNKFIADLEKSAIVEKVGETLLVLLDKFDDSRKSELLGKLVKTKISGEIDESNFFRLSHVVMHSYYPDLLQLKDLRGFALPSEELRMSLLSLGLIFKTTRSETVYFEKDKHAIVANYSLSDIGILLDRIINNLETTSNDKH
jgi:hypothetical protein